MNINKDNEALKNNWCVYRHISPSNKVYVGITKNLKERWSRSGARYKGGVRFCNAIKKYGWDNFKHEILFENLTLKEAQEKEINLISEYNSIDISFGYNMTSGGKVFQLCEESQKKKSNSLKGHPVSDKVRKILSELKSIPVICLETNEVYSSSLEASRLTGIAETCINKCVKGKQKTAGKLHWEKYYPDKQYIITNEKRIFSGSKKIICIETGETYDSISEAGRITGILRRSISYACDGTRKTAGGYQWKYHEELQ